MVFVGFAWSFAMVTLVLIVYTLVAYAWPNSLIGTTAATIK